MTDAAENRETPSAAVPNGLVCYVFGIFFPLLYLLLVRRGRQNSFLRFHCFQCLILFVIWSPFMLVRLPHGLAGGLSETGFLLCLLAWIVAMVQAGRRKRFHLPVIGRVAEQFAGS